MSYIGPPCPPEPDIREAFIFKEHAMNVERTYIMLKPDCIKRGLVGEVISRIEKKGYRITGAKMMRLDEALLREHYAHMVSKPFFPEILSYMTSGPVLALIVEGMNAVLGTRVLIGATEFEDMAVGTIRGDFAYCVRFNLIHGSDSPENAEIEIKRFFG
jgi:nucleoside-diphosphate kinase